MLKDEIERYIERERLFGHEQKLIVALSGGADSVALLRLLVGNGYRCEAAHCNFHLRGEESERDEHFVSLLCEKLGVKLHITHFNTTEYAANQKLSIEMAARELRYNWFEKLRKEIGAAYIAVAHHKDDSVETILLNLIRGTGIAGLTGIRPKNGHIVRPLLCASRTDITDYLRAIGQEYVTDSTNLVDEYTRNKIRLNIIPMLQEINPSVKESIAGTGYSLYEALSVYRSGIVEGKKRVLKDGEIDIEALLNEPSPRALLHEILYPLGFNPRQTDDIFASLNSQPGKQFLSKNGIRLIKDRNKLLLSDSSKKEDAPVKLRYREVEYTAEYKIVRRRDTICCDADKLTGDIAIRRWQRGDWFIPFGMRGRKLVSDYMTDHKFSLDQKEAQWLMTAGGKVVWLIGERADNRFRIDENTKRVIEISIEE